MFMRLCGKTPSLLLLSRKNFATKNKSKSVSTDQPFVPRETPTRAIFNLHDMDHQLHSKIFQDATKYRRMDIGPLLQNLKHICMGTKIQTRGPLSGVRVLFIANSKHGEDNINIQETQHVAVLRAAGATVDCLAFDEILPFVLEKFSSLPPSIVRVFQAKLQKAESEQKSDVPIAQVVQAFEILTGTSPSKTGTVKKSPIGTKPSAFDSGSVKNFIPYDLILLDDVMREKQVTRWDKLSRHLPLLATENLSGSPIQGLATALTLRDLGAQVHGQRVAYLGSAFTGYARELTRLSHLWKFSLLLSCPSTRKPTPSANRALDQDILRWEHENKSMSNIFYLDGVQVETDLFRTHVFQLASHPFLACKNADFIITDRFLTPNSPVPESFQKRADAKASKQVLSSSTASTQDKQNTAYDISGDRDIVAYTEDGTPVEQYDIEDCVLEGGKIVPGITAYEPDEEMCGVASPNVRILHRTPNVFHIKQEPVGLDDIRCGLSSQLLNEYTALVLMVKHIYISSRQRAGLPIDPSFFDKR